MSAFPFPISLIFPTLLHLLAIIYNYRTKHRSSYFLLSFVNSCITLLFFVSWLLHSALLRGCDRLASLPPALESPGCSGSVLILLFWTNSMGIFCPSTILPLPEFYAVRLVNSVSSSTILEAIKSITAFCISFHITSFQLSRPLVLRYLPL